MQGSKILLAIIVLVHLKCGSNITRVLAYGSHEAFELDLGHKHL
jgi:hypothetical protein